MDDKEFVEIVLKALDYGISHIDKVGSASLYNTEIMLSPELEVNIFNTFYNDDNLSVMLGFYSTKSNGERKGVTKEAKISQKEYNLIRFKLAVIEENLLNYKANQALDLLNSKDTKLITNIEDFDYNDD